MWKLRELSVSDGEEILEMLWESSVLESVMDGNCRYWIELSSEKPEGMDA